MRLAQYRAAVRVRLDLLQGAVALQELPRTVRLFQVSLRELVMRAQRAIPAAKKFASSLRSHDAENRPPPRPSRRQRLRREAATQCR